MPVLRLVKFAGDFDEILGFQSAARLVGGMIAPDPQRHAVARVRQGELAIGLLLAREFRRRRFHLDMDARGHRRRFARPGGFRSGTSVPCVSEAERREGSNRVISRPRSLRRRFATPEFPVGSVFKSSAFSCTTTDLPTIESAPLSLISLSNPSEPCQSRPLRCCQDRRRDVQRWRARHDVDASD